MREEFNFRQFVPDENLINYSKTTLEQIAAILPANSTVTAAMAKTGNIYFSHIEICSSEGNFKADAKSPDPLACIDNLDETIRMKIKNWKSLRLYKISESEWFSPLEASGR